jgi:hypothetical protein
VDGHGRDRGGEKEEREAAPIPAGDGTYSTEALGSTGLVRRSDPGS